VEKCGAVLVDRHALKKITVSSGILKEKEHTGGQIGKILVRIKEILEGNL